MKIDDTLEIKEEEVLYLAKTILEEKIRTEALDCTSKEEIKDYLQALLRTAERERFVVIHLDENKGFLQTDTLFVGTVDAASVYPREVLRAAISVNSKHLVLVHNHPRGVTEPSNADRRITRRLIEALALIDVEVADHFIVGGDNIESFVERGFI